ncbi:xylose isomerase-like protein [Aspergillus ambiguus]|uniref:xylose isomerase-like protein n=1 Tax=Aspergillus ambiguus TaxID=176160 RepID=UPI003CCD67A9
MFGKESKSDVEQVSDASDTNVAGPPTKPTFFQRWKTHMKKWWWAYLIGFCCIVLIIILPIVYVGIPRFASDYINNYKYDYDGLEITNPTPNSFRVKQSKSLSMGGGFSGSGHLSAFNATIKDADSNAEFAVFSVPRIEFNNGAEFNIDQDLEISCVSCLSDVAVQAASNQQISVLVTGDPYLKYGALPTAHLDIHKMMNMQEFVNSEGAFNVTSLDFSQTPDENGYNVNATVTVRNPTPFMVEMGEATFNLTISDTAIGYIYIPELTLQHNAHNVSGMVVLGNIDTDALIHEGLWGDSGEGFTVNIGIHGNKVVYNGVEIPYYTAAIRAIKATVAVNLMDYVGDVLAIGTLSLGQHPSHNLEKKIQVAAQYDFEAVEIVYSDLEAYAERLNIPILHGAQKIAAICHENNIEVLSLAPFENYEGASSPLHERLAKANHWIEIARTLKAPYLQVPSQFSNDCSVDESVIVSDLQKLADLGSAKQPLVSIAYENLSWGTYCSTWQTVLHLIQAVNRPNFGMCLDSFHEITKLWASPFTVSGQMSNAEKSLFDSVREFKERFPLEKLFYIQLHPWYLEGEAPEFTWSKHARPFPLETELGSYMPVADVLKAWVLDKGFTGWVSLEVFDWRMRDEKFEVETAGIRARESWRKLHEIVNAHGKCNL